MSAAGVVLGALVRGGALLAGGAGLFAAMAGCGSEPPPKAPEPPHEEHAARPPPLKMKSELGLVDPAAVTRGFRALDDKFDRCQKKGTDRVEVLGGEIKFFLRIGEDGSARWAYLEDSSLGDHVTEKCLLDAVLAARWPKPDGGDAEARYTMEMPAQGRPATAWDPGRIAAALEKASDAIDQCKGDGGNLRATLYVGPGGKVLAAGVAGAGKDGGARAECVAKALEKLKGVPSPGSWPAKVTVSL